MFHNRFQPSVQAIWVKGRHTITFGGIFSYTQLNTRDERTNKGVIGFSDFSTFLMGLPVTYSANGFVTTNFLNGDVNRHYRTARPASTLRTSFRFART